MKNKKRSNGARTFFWVATAMFNGGVTAYVATSKVEVGALAAMFVFALLAAMTFILEEQLDSLAEKGDIGTEQIAE